MLNITAEPETNFLKEVERDLKEYKKMNNYIDAITEDLRNIEGGGLTARYGTESAMPKAGGKADVVAREVMRRDRKWRRIEQMERKIRRIEAAADAITDIKQIILMELIMAGKTNREICAHMRLSRSYINEIKWQLVESLVAEIRKQEGERNE